MQGKSEKIRSLEWQGDSLKFIDQTALPKQLTYIQTKDYRDITAAIKSLQIRGAPAIGIAAAYAAVLAAQEGAAQEEDHFIPWMNNALKDIETARPTARNLSFAIERMRKILNRSDGKYEVCRSFLAEADRLHKEDETLCRKIGEFGAELINDGDSIITHCNTGMLVTTGIGTAFGAIITAVRQGKQIHLYADETRPLLQGARLTTWECMNLGVPVTLISDAAAADLLKRGRINCAVVGADRITANGDVANKIGTYSLAVNCRQHSVPFYVAAPYSTFDFSLKSGDEIPIEERNAEEITKQFGVAIAPNGVKVYNPAFDITPAKLITAIITDVGVFRPPYREWRDLKIA